MVHPVNLFTQLLPLKLIYISLTTRLRHGGVIDPFAILVTVQHASARLVLGTIIGSISCLDILVYLEKSLS